MVEAEANLQAAIVAGKALDRAQRQRLVWLGATSASYLVDALFLALFAAAGTVSAAVPLVYAAAAAAIGIGTFFLTVRGLNLKARDPSYVEPLAFLGIGMQLGVVVAAPQLAFPFLANLFTVFAFAMIWLSLRDSAMVWALGAVATGVALYAGGGRIGIPASSASELTLVWLYFSLILGRCLLLSMNSNEMRARIADSRRKLAVSLEQVQQLASHDELTGTFNRRTLLAALERERIRAERSGAPFSIAVIDLDHFKRVNDTYGHAAGDEVLRVVAATVRATMRATDVFGRYGGEEFLMILVGAAAPLALEAMERVRGAVAAKSWPTIAADFSVTLSSGIAAFRKSETTEQLLHRADQALYAAKHGGRNQTVASPA
jgi:diguanylate cyclase (GGDEF)-like protein